MDSFVSTIGSTSSSHDTSPVRVSVSITVAVEPKYAAVRVPGGIGGTPMPIADALTSASVFEPSVAWSAKIRTVPESVELV